MTGMAVLKISSVIFNKKTTNSYNYEFLILPFNKFNTIYTGIYYIGVYLQLINNNNG